MTARLNGVENTVAGAQEQQTKAPTKKLGKTEPPVQDPVILSPIFICMQPLLRVDISFEQTEIQG